MKNLTQKGSIILPTIDFDAKLGILKILGRSIPEHPVDFYKPINQWIKDFLKTKPSQINFHVHLDYLNTHSTECMLIMLKFLEDYAIKNPNSVMVYWFFDEDDEDMEILGEDIASLVDLPFEFKEVKDL